MQVKERKLLRPVIFNSEKKIIITGGSQRNNITKGQVCKDGANPVLERNVSRERQFFPWLVWTYKFVLTVLLLISIDSLSVAVNTMENIDS